MKDSKVIAIAAGISGFLSLVTVGIASRRRKVIESKIPSVLQLTQSNLIQTAAGAFNNPGNIRKSETTYEGEIDLPDSSFTSFSSMPYGYRAMIQILRHHYWNGDKNLKEIISTYAPAADNNNVDSYVNDVSNRSGINPTADLYSILYSDKVEDLISAMAEHEQGSGFTVLKSDVEQAYDLLT